MKDNLVIGSRGSKLALTQAGMVKTEMTAGHGQVEAADAVRGLLARIDELKVETSGRLLHATGQELPW